MPFLLQLLLRALPLLAGFGGSIGARGLATGAARKLAPSLLGKTGQLGPGLGFLANVLGFAGGETVAEKIPGVPSSGEGFLERLPLLAAGFGGAHVAGKGLQGLVGKKGFEFLGKSVNGTTVPKFLPEQAAGLGGFIGGHTAGSLLLPQSEHEDEGAQESALHGNVDSRRITQNDEEQFLELLNELQFQSEDEEQRIDPQLIQQIMQSALGQSLV